MCCPGHLPGISRPYSTRLCLCLQPTRETRLLTLVTSSQITELGRVESPVHIIPAHFFSFWCIKNCQTTQPQNTVSFGPIFWQRFVHIQNTSLFALWHVLGKFWLCLSWTSCTYVHPHHTACCTDLCLAYAFPQGRSAQRRHDCIFNFRWLHGNVWQRGHKGMGRSSSEPLLKPLVSPKPSDVVGPCPLW